MVDGAVATRTRSSGSMLGALDVDTVQEVQVLTADYSAEYGRSSAGQIRFRHQERNADLHGDLVENFRNSALDANTWTRNHSPLAQIASGAAPYRFNQYGFDVGGPVFIPKHFNSDRNKLFFFYAEEWTKRRYETTNTGTVPSLAMRNGDFSELLDPANPFFKKVRAITDPLTNAPFPGNIIPVSRISHNGQALLNVFPQPVPGFQQGTANWIGTKSTHSDLRKDTFKVDYLINPSERLSVRGTNTPWHFNAPFEDTFGRMEEVWSRPNRIGAVSLISTLSPTLVNEFNFSANSDGKGDIQFGSYCAACLRSQYGLNYPFLFPGTKIASGEGSQHPHPGPDHARRRPLSRLLGRFRLRLDRQPDEDFWHTHDQMGRLPGAFRPERFHSGHHRRPRHHGQSEWRFHLQRFRKPGYDGPVDRQRHPGQFRHLFGVWSQGLHALCGHLARSVRAG